MLFLQPENSRVEGCLSRSYTDPGGLVAMAGMTGIRRYPAVGSSDLKGRNPPPIADHLDASAPPPSSTMIAQPISVGKVALPRLDAFWSIKAIPGNSADLPSLVIGERSHFQSNVQPRSGSMLYIASQ